MKPADLKSTARILADIVDRKREVIEQRWLDRVQRDVARTPGLELTHLRDGLPDYLVALVALLRSGNKTAESSVDSASAWSRIAREHGITRVRIGFDISQLIHEFVILRHVIRDVVVEDDAMASVETILSDILDAGITDAVQAYVEARDFDARRRQAEHIGFLTHELRNPLSTAILAASRLRRNAPPEQLPLLDILDRNHHKLSELIDGVLLTQKLEAGKVECQPSEVTLGEVMEEALESARATASEKGLAFRATYNADLHIRVDPALTRAAVQNVADNAARYTDSGGIEVTVDDRRDDFVIHVCDSCHGISDEELRTIFEPFERGSTRKPGTGLGLTIARRAVEAQGGSIGAESPGLSGCHFWIQLPK